MLIREKYLWSCDSEELGFNNLDDMISVIIVCYSKAKAIVAGNLEMSFLRVFRLLCGQMVEITDFTIKVLNSLKSEDYHPFHIALSSIPNSNL